MRRSSSRGSAHYRLLDRRLGDSVTAKRETDDVVRLREGLEQSEQTLKDMHIQLITQIQKDRNPGPPEGTSPNSLPRACVIPGFAKRQCYTCQKT
jgi:hypothetical protein